MSVAADIIVLVGLPASGKSQRMNREHEADQSLATFDDFLGVKKRAIGPEGLLEMFKILREGGRVLCNDVFLCQTETRDLFVAFLESTKSDIKIRWVCFENDPEACIENAVRSHAASEVGQARDERLSDRRNLIEDLTRKYTYPSNYEMERVYRP